VCSSDLTFSLAKIATEGGAHPIGLTLWQGLLGGLTLGAICLARRQPPRLTRQHIRFYGVCALLGTLCPSVLFFYAAPHVPAGVLSITVATVPILTYVLSSVLKIDVLSPKRVAGILLGLLAVALLIGPEASLPDRAMVPWVLAAVLASTFYACENIFIAQRRPPGTDAVALVCGMSLMAALILAPIVAATGTFVSLGFPWGPVEWSIVAMAMISVTAYALFIALIKMSGPVFASQSAYTVTISGVFWGMAIFGEQHSFWFWTALAVMLAGLALVTPRRNSQT
jgi:drug/metabolite transporter (DMT)-like permease